jgi:hypothetical protein
MFRTIFIRFFAATMLVSLLLFMFSCDEDHVIVLDTLHLDQKEFIVSSEGGNYDVNSNETIQMTNNSKNFQLSNTERFTTLEQDKLETVWYSAVVDSSNKKILHLSIQPNETNIGREDYITVFSGETGSYDMIHIKQSGKQ